MTGIDFAEKFRRFEEQYRKPDGTKWRNKDIEDATDGFVSGNYISNLKQGRYKNPGHDRLLAIAEVMGFPAELWYYGDEQVPGEDTARGVESEGKSTLAEKLNFLMGARNDPRTGEALTEEAVSELAAEAASAADLRAARKGEISRLSPDQYHALSNVFGVDMAFWYRGFGQIPAVEPETVESLRDRDAEDVLNKFHRLRNPEDRALIRSLLDRFYSRDE